MRLSILGKDSKTKDDKPLGVVDAYVKENTTELVDPLDIKKKIESLEEKEPYRTVGGIVNWCSHCGKQYGDASEN